MKRSDRIHYRCVIGEVPSQPNELTYLQSISNRRYGVWVGYCKGDRSHQEHIIVIRKRKKYYILNDTSNSFKKPDGTIFGSRLFERILQLRCPVGKVHMNLQRKATSDLNIDTVDFYRCKGRRGRIGSGHKAHFVKIQHGELEVKINKKTVGVLIVTIED